MTYYTRARCDYVLHPATYRRTTDQGTIALGNWLPGRHEVFSGHLPRSTAATFSDYIQASSAIASVA